MKSLTLILAVLALLGSAASGYFWWQIGDTKKQLQEQLSAEQSRVGTLQSDLTRATEERTALQSSLARTDGELGDTKRSLTAAEARNVQIAREAETLKRTVAAKEEAERKLNADLEVLRRELVQTRLASQVGSPEEVEKQRQTIAGLEARIAELQSRPSAGSASSVGSDGSASSIPLSARTQNARVAQVGPRNAFVVLELGTGDGVVAGQKLTIARGGSPIAEALVSSVENTFVIAQVAPASIQTALRVGDTASIAR
jgi:septal ring factor EnvC (AmiA/AmiB activator)